MTADTIKAIADAIPKELAVARFSPPSIELSKDKRIGFPADPQLGAFVHLYKNTAIGWHAAAIFASVGKAFPVALKGEDHWVFKAYLYCVNPERHRDPHLLEAIVLAHPEMKGARDVIEALLMTENYGDVKKIAKATGLAARTISCYEKLFFNVLDRRKDNMYIRNIVYPESRLIELFDGYANNEDFGMLLKRYGYNYKGSELLYLAGLPDTMVDDIPSGIAAGKLEGVLMSQGYMLTKLGFVNQTKHSQAIYHARSVIAAAKQGGQETGDADLPMSSVSDLLYETFKIEKREQAAVQIELKKAHGERGVVIDVG